MKKLCLLMAGIYWIGAAMACPVCERNQPRILRGITHGGGAESRWDYVIVSSMMAVVVLTLVYSIRWLVRPGERNKDHIKHTILNPAFYE